MIAHTHNDVGWLKTVDSYFSGTDQVSAPANVHLVLDAVTDVLLNDPTKVFSYCEMRYFTMWYENLNQSMKDNVKKLIKNGQLEIVQGGWVATDEACPNYEDIILNMQKGHAFLQKEFGYKPTVGWMIDAFGHSAANAALFSDFGFEALFFSRDSLDDLNIRMEDKKMSFIWKPFSKHFGDQKEIFTYIMHKGYGFDHDIGFLD
jgi:alpha-mannosidase